MKLDTPISRLPFVGPTYINRLERLGIKTIEDLLYHVPHRYQDFRIISDISKAQVGETLTIKGRVLSIKNVYTKYGKVFQKALVADKTDQIQVIWFNQRYLVKSIREGEIYSFSGKIDWFDRKKSLISPDYERIGDTKEPLHTGRLVPIYRETSGISSKWLRARIFEALANVKPYLEEFLPEDLLKENNFLKFEEALTLVHYPNDLSEAEKAKERLAFNELLFYQLNSLYRKKDWQKIPAAHKLKIDKNLLKTFISSLPFTLTNSQLRAINELYEDLKKDFPMNRLLEGDVGSGKTVVAAACTFASFVNGFQSVIMAPTQILAEQHFNTLKQIFENFKVRVSLITSAGIKADLGKTDIFVGTHALIHKKVKFDNVALVVIDEQHRFGVEQRAHLIQKTGKKRKAPHVLTMTATPIPRTVALTIYSRRTPKRKKTHHNVDCPSPKKRGCLCLDTRTNIKR